ncbi:PREDICTED: uncharacterized protein LOC104802898 [Tarenaya hassleriana]|uniref:uncharacterized protein LOC104802898 n=1 Tax=Tarenaya hassleriana TaxID=28532 RepID=UPI00053C9ECE|nr:PREDICTED: uncharacterized protein LOC104802898 [Tarenaya hassleriana]
MDQRKSDWRIYIVTALFLSCIISGGMFLGLYLFLPNPSPLFLQAGMIFVGFPWLFWFMGYLYTCVIRPCTDQIPREQGKSVTNVDPEKGNNNNDNKNSNTTVSENTTSEAADGEERHVQFGNVTVIGSGDGIDQAKRQEHVGEEEEEENGRVIVRGGDGGDHDSNVDDRDEKGSDFSGDCDKTPLRLSVTNASYRD